MKKYRTFKSVTNVDTLVTVPRNQVYNQDYNQVYIIISISQSISNLYFKSEIEVFNR